MPRSRARWLGAAVVVLAIAGVGLAFALGAFPPGTEPQADPLQMVGDVGEVGDPTHDPALIRHEDEHYVFSTGELRTPDDPGGIYVRRSRGGLEGPWQSLGEIDVPDWTHDYGPAHLWAPQVVQRDGLHHLYYAASSFGTNASAIGLMTSATPGDLGSWNDHGPVLTSQAGDHYNAIDPHVLEAEGTWWIAFGSHWDGIFLQELHDMEQPVGEMHHLASRPGVEHNPIEAPTIFEHDGFHYLLTSWDRCCAGLESTYRITVGRSEEVTGPYVDRDGRPLLEGGGTVSLDSSGRQIGPGGQDVLLEEDQVHLVHHYYDAEADGTIRMQIRTIAWSEGWPVLE